MLTFDYYVSGIKLNHQVPRFETPALIEGKETSVKLNDWLQKLDWGSYEILSDEDGYVRVLICVDEEEDDD